METISKRRLSRKAAELKRPGLKGLKGEILAYLSQVEVYRTMFRMVYRLVEWKMQPF